MLEAVKVAAKALQVRIEEDISTPVVRDFTGQPVTRAEQGLGPGDPPRLDSGDLHANVDSSAELSANGAVGTVSSSRNENPMVPYYAEINPGFAPYMEKNLLNFEKQFIEILARETARMLGGKVSVVKA
jgi:hypothetical protein